MPFPIWVLIGTWLTYFHVVITLNSRIVYYERRGKNIPTWIIFTKNSLVLSLFPLSVTTIYQLTKLFN